MSTVSVTLTIKESQTGQQVHPSAVRLAPPAAAPYDWQILQPEAAQLFRKPLSRCNINDCRDIMAGLGHDFQACLRGQNCIRTEPVPTADEEDCKLTEVREPTEFNGHSLTREARCNVDERIRLENDLFMARTRIEEFETRLRETNEMLANQETQLFQYDMMMGRISQVLQEYHQSSQAFHALC